MSGYSLDLRCRVIDDCLAKNGTQYEIADRFSISRTTVVAWYARFRQSGSYEGKGWGGGRSSKVDLASLLALVASEPEASSWELTAAYNKGRRGQSRVHRSSILRALAKENYVYKKKTSARGTRPS